MTLPNYPLLKKAQLAELFGVDNRQIERFMKRGMPYLRLSRNFTRFMPGECLLWVAQSYIEATAKKGGAR